MAPRTESVATSWNPMATPAASVDGANAIQEPGEFPSTSITSTVMLATIDPKTLGFSVRTITHLRRHSETPTKGTAVRYGALATSRG